MATNPSPEHRLAFLDSLRGIAALWVVFYHLIYIPSPNLAMPEWVAPWASIGGRGVTLFFLVSAFSLCYAMPLHERERHPLRLFYTRRFFRIAPLLYVMLAVTLLRDFIMWRATHSPAEVAENLFFVFNLVPGKQTGIVWASWSIGVEVVFYVLFPVFYFWAKDIFRACMLLLGAVALAMAFRISLASYSATAVEFFPMSFLRHLPIFALGIAAFRFYERFGKHQIRPAEAILLVITLVIFDASALTLDAVFDDAYYLQGPWFVALLLGLAVRPVSLLVNKVTKALGKLSYSLYLIHPPLILMMIPIYRRVYAWNLPLDVKYWVVVVLTFGVLITISYLSYRFIEEPGIRLGKRIARTDRMMPVEKSA